MIYIKIIHYVGDNKKLDEKYEIKGEELEKLWNLIEVVDFTSRISPDTPGLPDQVKYVFKFEKDNLNFEYSDWESNCKSDINIKKLVEFIKDLIINYTKMSPVF